MIYIASFFIFSFLIMFYLNKSKPIFFWKIINYSMYLFIIIFSIFICNIIEVNLISLICLILADLSLFFLILGLEDPSFLRLKINRAKIVIYTLSSFLIFISILINFSSIRVVEKGLNSEEKKSNNMFSTSENKEIHSNKNFNSDSTSNILNEKQLITIREEEDDGFFLEEYAKHPDWNKINNDVKKMRRNNLNYADFILLGDKNIGLGQFMKNNNLKFTDLDLNCFGVDKCVLYTSITRQEYESIKNGVVCGAKVAWSAQHNDLKAWKPINSTLAYSFNKLDIASILEKIDYEHTRIC